MFTTRRSLIRALGVSGIGAAALMLAAALRVQPVIDAGAKQDLLIGRLVPPLTRTARISIGALDELNRGLDVLDTVLRAGTGH